MATWQKSLVVSSLAAFSTVYMPALGNDIELQGHVSAQRVRTTELKFQMPLAAPLEVNPAVNNAWSLPIEDSIGIANGAGSNDADGDDNDDAANNDGKVPLKGKRVLDACINMSDGANAIAHKVEDLINAAWDKDDQADVLDKAVTHYNTKRQKVIAETKDTCDYIIPFRGFGPSSEASDVILNEKVKLKSRASAEFARQTHVDELHLQVVSNMMQIAMGIGMSDHDKGAATVDSGMSTLKNLVGNEEATRTFEMLNTWTKEIDVPQSVYNRDVWDVTTRQEKVKTILQDALDYDPVLKEITSRLHKYNQHSKFSRVSSHVVQTTLGAAALTPSFVGPAAKAALVTYVMATGGPEQCKLLKQLYLDKRFQSRWKALNEQAHLAVDNYQLAMLTHNKPLLACSESLVEEMSGAGAVQKAFGTTVVPHEIKGL